MPKIDSISAPIRTGTRYPAPFDGPCKERCAISLGDAAGLTQFGVNIVRLPPGVWSSQRHWHALEDEFVYVLEGEVVLVTDDGEETMRRGESAGFKAGVKNGHCLQNRSNADAVVLTVGSRNDADYGEYSDIDLAFEPGRYSMTPSAYRKEGGYRKKSGTPYP